MYQCITVVHISMHNCHTQFCNFSYNNVVMLFFVQVVFVIDGNAAIAGSGVYTNYLSLCSWSSFTEPFFDVQKTYRWDTFDYRHVHNITNISIAALVLL